ncbi:MAG: undecaprenyl-diphosphate phosphatase [Candidatus Geothermincolia bacterium]
MPIYQALILGALQGFTEFWPISSSAHLSLAQWLFGWGTPQLSFSVALHAGTLLAVIVFFRKRLFQLLVAFIASLRELEIGRDPDRRLAWFLLVAAVPAFVAGAGLSASSEAMESMPLLMALMLVLLGGVLYRADAAHGSRELESMGWREALAVGTAQALALVPGVSRSGATISTALFAGFGREQAAEFAFLLSVPTIGGAVGYQGLKMLTGEAGSAGSGSMLVGFLAAAVTGFVAVRYLLRFVQHGSYRPFAWYRLGLALAVVAVALSR